jgi:glycosyltransferase involved in cell wall biosynthesis
MKSITIVITRMDLGGAQQVALETVSRLNPKRFDVVLISGPGGMMDAQARKQLGPRFVICPWLTHPISPLKDLMAFFWLVRWFFSRRIDLVHTHSSKAGLLGRLAAWAAGVETVVHTVHGWSFNDFMGPFSRGLYVLLERFAATVTDRLVCVAQSVIDKGLLNRIGGPGQYALIRAAVDLKSWRAAGKNAAKARRVLGLPRGCALVGTMANCKPQKNPLDFVRVAAKVIARAPKTHFVYLGDGPLKSKALDEAFRLGIAKQVRFPGWQENAANLSAGFDVFLLTSLWEGLPCVFPQVMCQGVPVVATAVDGASEIVREGQNGFLCQPKDVDALADRVVLLLKDKSLCRKMSLAAARSVGREWDIPDMVEKTEKLYAGSL